MQNEYNTREIRAVGSALGRISSQLQDLVSSKASHIGDQAVDLRGETINALRTELEKMTRQIDALQKNVDSCSRAMYEFARQLDLADQEASKKISAR